MKSFSKVFISMSALLALSMPTSAATTSRSSGGGTHTSTSATRSAGTTASRSAAGASRSAGLSASRSTTSVGSRSVAGSRSAMPGLSRSASPTRTMSKQAVVKSVQSNKTPVQSEAISRASHSQTYSSLHSESERVSFLDWSGIYGGAYSNPINYFTNVGYFWMPGNIWHNAMTNQTQDNLSKSMITQAQKRNYKWIKIKDQMVAVPQSIYDKIKVGDTVKLIDGHHIQINGKTYTH